MLTGHSLAARGSVAFVSMKLFHNELERPHLGAERLRQRTQNATNFRQNVLTLNTSKRDSVTLHEEIKSIG